MYAAGVPSISRLSVAPVTGLALLERQEAERLGLQADVAEPVGEHRLGMPIVLAGDRPRRETRRRNRLHASGAAPPRPRGRVSSTATTRGPARLLGDLATLEAISAYRGLRGSVHIDLGPYREDEQPDRVGVGDPADRTEEE